MLDKIPSIRGLELYCAAKPSTDIKKTLKKIDLKKDLKKSQRSLRPCDLGISSSTFQPPFLLANHLRPKPSPVRHSNLSHFARLESIIILPKLASFQHLEFLPIVSQYTHCSLHFSKRFHLESSDCDASSVFFDLVTNAPNIISLPKPSSVQSIARLYIKQRRTVSTQISKR